MLSVVLLIVAMLILSAFFSGMEIAFTSKNRLKLEIDRKQSRMFDRIAEVFSTHPGQYITTILVGNNIALVVYSLAMSQLLRAVYGACGWEHLAQNGSVAADTAISTIIIIFFAEFLPKSVFKNNPNFYYRALAPVIYFFYIILYPVARFTTLLSHGILRLMGRRVEEKNITPSFNREDLAALLDASVSEQNAEPDHEFKLFQNALDFSNIRIRDCMVPRTEVVAVDVTTELEELKNLFVESGLSKIIVYDGNIDNVIGYIHSSEMFRHPADWRNSVKPVPIVPETMPAHRLMKLFMQQKKTIAVVVDEFGGTSGIVSLEDLVEEIFGDIEDEHDNTTYVCKQVGEHEYVLSARLEIEKVKSELSEAARGGRYRQVPVQNIAFDRHENRACAPENG